MRNSIRVVALLLLLVLAASGRARGEDEDNPHEKMVRSKSVCVDCHTRVLKPEEHAADYFLVDTPSEHCLGCHSDVEHVGVKEHLGKDAPKELPGDEHGKIACFTCHDPHPQGVLPGRTVHRSAVSPSTRAFIAARTWSAPLERREPSEAFDALLRTSSCASCHATLEDKPWRERTTWSEAIRVLPR